MKVLMYGWEFPPRISGGLGIACHAIVKELTKKHVNLTLILPQSVEGSDLSLDATIIGCNSDGSSESDKSFDSGTSINKVEVETFLRPYISAADYQHFLSRATLQDFFALVARMHLPGELKDLAISAVHAQDDGSKITGRYDIDLFVDVFRYALAAGAFASNIEHDVIHAHDWLTMLAGVEAKRRSHKPLVLHIHALETDRSGFATDKRIFAIEKFGMEQADKIIAVSQYTKDMIIKHYGIPAEKIAVVHNGIYLNERACSGQMAVDHPKMVLFVGRVTHQKGPSCFVEIAKRVLEKIPNVQFVIAGTGDLMRGTIEKVAGLRIGTNVHFTGFLNREEIDRAYQLADVYVMPSVSEPFGISALEALAHDVPVVITKQSGVSEVIKNALISDFWDVEDIAAKILAYLAYPALRRFSVANAKSELQHLAWENAAEKIIAVYNEQLKI